MDLSILLRVIVIAVSVWSLIVIENQWRSGDNKYVGFSLLTVGIMGISAFQSSWIFQSVSFILMLCCVVSIIVREVLIGDRREHLKLNIIHAMQISSITNTIIESVEFSTVNYNKYGKNKLGSIARNIESISKRLSISCPMEESLNIAISYIDSITARMFKQISKGKDAAAHRTAMSFVSELKKIKII